MIGVDDDQHTRDRKDQKENLKGEVEKILLGPHQEQKNVDDNRSDEIKVKHDQTSLKPMQSTS
jgi:hypothetical protein